MSWNDVFRWGKPFRHERFVEKLFGIEPTKRISTVWIKMNFNVIPDKRYIQIGVMRKRSNIRHSERL